MTGLGEAEISWFGALCDDDCEFLGVADPARISTWDHCAAIVRDADRLGFDNVLLPSGYQLGIDTIAFAAAIGPQLRRSRLLTAVRCGESWPPQLARQLATLDQILGGRLTVNIISSDLPGQTLESEPRYRRTLEVMQIVRALLDGEAVDHHGEFFDLVVDPPRIRPESGAPPFYFGGLSSAARAVAAAGADVYLMWPDTLAGVAANIADLTERADSLGRRLRFGFRVHVIVREAESEARAAADRLVSRLDDREGATIKRRALDATSAGVAQQTDLRDSADADGYVDRHLWTGIGRARSGCGAAIVGDPDQVRDTLAAYADLGIDAFILSGYPHRDEAEHFARHVLHPLRDGR